jgi:hypothetical protein
VYIRVTFERQKASSWQLAAKNYVRVGTSMLRLEEIRREIPSACMLPFGDCTLDRTGTIECAEFRAAEI